MKIFSYLIVLTLLCLLSADINGEENVREKRNPLAIFEIVVQLLTTVLPLGLDIFKQLSDTWNHAGDAKRETIRQLKEISLQIKKLEDEVKTTVNEAVATLLRSFPALMKIELILHDLTLIQDQINFADEQMRIYLVEGYKRKSESASDPFAVIPFRTLRPPNKTMDYTLLEQMTFNTSNRAANSKRIMETFTLLDFATWAISHNFNSLISLLRRMNDLVAGEGQSLFEKILHVTLERSTNICALRYSPYQTLYNLYISIAVAELKGNYVLQFSYMILKIYQKGDFISESKIALQAYGRYAKEKLDSLVKVLSVTDRSIYKCDVTPQVEGETYTYLTRFLQAYIENKVNMNHDHECWQNCKYYSPKTKNYGCSEHLCKHQPRCQGTLYDCKEASDDMNICVSDERHRRYKWIKYEDGSFHGKGKGWCSNDYVHVEMWHRWLFWPCSYCLCVCDDKSGESERYFNLRKVTSDRENNKIVTGVRIVKKNKIIHLQIQEGVLNPVGVVNTTTLSWKPIEDYTVSENNMEDNEDYFTMNYNFRALNTNELTALPGYVVTGIGFRKTYGHVDLDVHVTPFNFTSGKLELLPSNHSYWIANNETHPQTGGQREKISLWKPDVPVDVDGPHLQISKKNQYVLFRQTDFDKDAGQSTVPYFDSQPVTSEGFALSGFGLIHRGRSGSGGFIAPKLISYDFAAHLNITTIN